MENGMLTGVRYDGAPKGDTVHITVGLDNTMLAPDTHVSYIADNRDTDANEAATKVTVAGESISLGDLLGIGHGVEGGRGGRRRAGRVRQVSH